MRFFLKLPIFHVIAFTSSVFFAWGQDPSNMPQRQLISETRKLLDSGDFAGVAPLLDELEVRFQDENNPEIERLLSEMGFVRGVGYLQSYAESGTKDFLSKAAKAFGEYAEKFPKDPKAVIALQKRTDCLRSDEQWDQAAKVVIENY